MVGQNANETTLLINRGKGDEKRTSKYTNPTEPLDLICDSSNWYSWIKLILKYILTFLIELESTIKEKDDKGQEKEVKVICNNRPVKSEVQSKTGTGTWLCVLFWCVLTVFGGLVPFFVK